jgi:flagellar hook-basal body protein
MSLIGSLFSGVSALAAQAQQIAMISNNIANANTTGFKRSEASFRSLVTTQNDPSRYSPGTVGVTRIQRVTQNGGLQQTAIPTHVALSGNGFVIVQRSPNEQGLGGEFLYTRNGSFSEDRFGYLQNEAGYYLYGWPLDQNGELPVASGDVGSTEAVNASLLDRLARQTTSATIEANLNASEEFTYNPLPIFNTSPDFTRGLRVYDSLGAPQDMRLEFRKTIGPTAFAQSTTPDIEPNMNLLTDPAFTGLSDGDSFTLQVGAAPAETITIGSAPGNVSTLTALIATINAYGGGDVVNAMILKGRLVIQAQDLADSMTLTEVSGTPLFGPASLGLPNPSATASETFAPTDMATAYPDQSDYPEFNPSDDANNLGWWEVTVLSPTGENLRTGLINFNQNGLINAIPDENGLIDINITNADWNNGSAPQNINLSVGQITHFTGLYNVVSLDQNGAELGLRTGISIDRDGYVTAQFSNGLAAKIYRLPVVVFNNANRLVEESGSAYAGVVEAGEPNLRLAGQGGAGYFESATLELSNVELADEFARMIVTQRSYSAATKVIKTADEMTEELLRIR